MPWQNSLAFVARAVCEYPLRRAVQVPEPAWDLIEKMLTKDPERRITLPQIARHHWVTHHEAEPLILNDKLTSAGIRANAI